MFKWCPFFWSRSTPQASLPLLQHHSLLPKSFRQTLLLICASTLVYNIKLMLSWLLYHSYPLVLHLKVSLLVISPILLPSNFNNYSPISLSLVWIPPTSNILNWIFPNLLPVFLIALDILQLISSPTCPLISLTLWIWPVVFNGQLLELMTGEFSRLSNKEPPHGQLISHAPNRASCSITRVTPWPSF